jgi:4'-phosphopantetheinyl transferase
MQSLQVATPRERTDTLPAACVTLRILRTDSIDEGDARLLGLLDAAEAARARAFRVAADRKSYVAAHALLRTLLSNRSAGPRAPDAWRFETGAHGKPSLAAGPAFNLSHCRGMVAVAIAQGIEIGVDVESLARNDFDEAAIAQSTFHATEREWLRRIDDGARRKAAFLSLWTAKEALIKAVGDGLSMPLDGFAVDLDRVRYRHDDATARDWSLHRWELPGHLVALAAPGAAAVECRESRWDAAHGVFVDGTELVAVKPEVLR